jgi:hypothetical protein
MEIYTSLFVIQGYLTMSAQRTSDILNRVSTNFLTVYNASITPLGQQPSPRVQDNPIIVKLAQINFVVEMPSDTNAPTGPQIRTGSLSVGGTGPMGGTGSLAGTGPIGGREAYVSKDHYPCYAITGPYAIYGQCHLHKGTTLENLLQSVDNFIPITNPTVYAMSHPNLNWKPNFVIVNKALLTAMYIMPKSE